MSNVIPKEFQEMMTQNERGNTLILEDCNMIFIAEVADNQWFFVQYLPDNYPGIDTFFVEGTEAEIRQKVQADWSGYFCRKNNLGLAVNNHGQLVSFEDEM